MDGGLGIMLFGKRVFWGREDGINHVKVPNDIGKRCVDINWERESDPTSEIPPRNHPFMGSATIRKLPYKEGSGGAAQAFNIFDWQILSAASFHAWRRQLLTGLLCCNLRNFLSDSLN